MAAKFSSTRVGNRVNRSLSGDVGVTIFLIAFALIMFVPLYWAITIDQALR